MLGIFHIGPARKISAFGHVLNPLLTELIQNRFKVYKWVVENLESHEFKNFTFVEFNCLSLRTMEN